MAASGNVRRESFRRVWAAGVGRRVSGGGCRAASQIERLAMHIDIFSDTVCPWCFIGKRRLEQALRQAGPLDLTIRWRAFQLNPAMPAAGIDRQNYLSLKFGGADNAARVYATIAEAGESVGLPFRFDRIGRTPNTLKSHQLIHFAARQGDQDPLVERLFSLYFFEGEDIGEMDVLLDAASDVGLDRDAAADVLASEDARQAVAMEDQQAREAGIQGVPSFILDGRYAVSGAQEPEVLLRMFDLARENEAAQPTT
jgi:predicted DsbA family dithiol-disulfide isomerase